MKNNVDKLCYVRGVDQPYSHPTHARRFPNFARRNDIRFEDFHDTGLSAADITILSPAVDLSFWKRHRSANARIIFDANDPYLLDTSKGLKRIFRGAAKFVTGRHKYFDADYHKLYREICESSNAVVVSHFAQRDLLNSWGINVWEIKDYPPRHVQSKRNYELTSENTVNIFWEGLGSSFLPFHLLEEIFASIPDRKKYRFHFVTDLHFKKYMDRFVNLNIEDVAKKNAPSLYQQFYFYQWTSETFSRIANQCDFALIPLPMDYSMNFWKPETKVIQLWRAGLPIIASGIPSYRRAFEEAEVDGCCNSILDWRKKINDYSLEKVTRERNAVLGQEYVQQFTPDKIDQKWRDCLRSIS